MKNKYLSSKKHSLSGKYLRLRNFINLLVDKEEWNLDEIVKLAKEKLDISSQTVWNYLLEIDKEGLIKLEIFSKESKFKDKDNPSFRRVPIWLRKKK